MANPEFTNQMHPSLAASTTYSASLFVGEVTEVFPMEIKCGDGSSLRAVVAAGLSYGLCRGDTVLAVHLNSQCWVLEVLQLADNPTRQFHVHAASSIRLMAEHIELKTGVLQVQATGSVFRMGMVRITATSVTAVCHKIHTWTRNWFLRARVVATRATQRISRVDTADVLRAHDVDVQLTGAHNITAQETHISARDNASMNGRKVLLG
jgi:hypothetical protein